MITQIQFGNTYASGGKTLVGGSASGYDTEGLIKGLTEAKRLPAVKLEKELETNAKKSTALTELRSILSRFQDSANLLRNPPGVANASSNIFEYRKASLSTNTAVAASNYLNVTTEPGASLADYDITVDALATQNVKTTETFALANLNTNAVGSGLPFRAGTMQLGPGNASITLDAGDTLKQVIDKINASKVQSGVEASAIKVADGQYRVQLKTLTTGTAQNYAMGVEPTTPAFFSSAVLRLDAGDMDGDGDRKDNPSASYGITTMTDGSHTTTISSFGTAPTFQPTGPNGVPVIQFNGNGGLTPANSPTINTNTTFTQKTFALSFNTGSDITGTQTIYEQGTNNRSFGVFVAPDPNNGNTPTLFATVRNSGWTAPDQSKVLNLGAVSANQHYNVELSFDASTAPTANSAVNTFTGFVNGTQKAQATNVRDMLEHTGVIGIGGTNTSSFLPNGTAQTTSGAYFKGSIEQVAQFNRVLTGTERTEMNSYYTARSQPVNNGLFNVGFALTQDATDAKITVDGTAVTRPTNSVNDLFDKVTLNLSQITPPGTEIDVKVQPDTDIVKNAILGFMDSYNEFRLFASKQTETAVDGKAKDTALLASNATLRSTLSRIYGEMNTTIAGLAAGDPARLADLGITFSDFAGDTDNPFTRNILKVNEDKLNSALSGDFDAVRRVFEFNFNSSDADFQVFKRAGTVGVNNFTINANVTGNSFTATYLDTNNVSQTVTLTPSPISGGGFLLKAPEDSLFRGLELIYGGSTNTTSTVSISQGIGDRMFNALDTIVSDDGGLLTVEEEAVTKRNTRIEEEVTRLDEIIERYRDQLLQKFSALESAIASINTILQSLDAQSKAQQNN